MTAPAPKLSGMKQVWLPGCLVLGIFGSVGAVSLPIDTVITGHTGWTTGGALSPDGTQLALVSRSTVYLTDLKSGQQKPLPGHTGPVTRVAYSQDGQVLFTGGNDGTLKRWDTRAGKLLSSVQACGPVKGAPQYHEAVYTIAVQNSRDVVVGCDSELQFWSGEQRGETLKGTIAALSADGKQLLVGYGEEPLRLYDLSSMTVKATLNLLKLAVPMDVFTTPGPPSALAFSPDGKRAAVAFDSSVPKAENFRAAVYDTDSGELLFELGGRPDYVQGLAFSADGRTLLTTGRSSTKLYDAHSGELIRLLQPPNTRIGVQAVAWLPGAKQVMAVSVQKGAQVLDLQGKVTATYSAPGDMVTALAWNPSGTLLATGGMDGLIQLWKGNTRAGGWAAHQGGVTGLLGVNSLAFSPDGRRLFSTGQDASVRLWTVQGKKLSQLDGQSNTPDFPRFSPDGQRLVFGDGVGLTMLSLPKFLQKPDWQLRPFIEAIYKQGGQKAYNDPQVWQKLTGNTFWAFKMGGGSTYAVCLLPDGRTVRELSAATGGSALTQYDALTGKQVRKLLPAAKFDNLYTASFSPDCGRFAFGRVDGGTEVWRVSRSFDLLKIIGFKGQGRIYRTAFSPDGRRVAVNRGESLTVFDLKKSAETGSYQGLSANTYALAFNPQGTKLAVGSGTTGQGGTVTVFRLPEGK